MTTNYYYFFLLRSSSSSSSLKFLEWPKQQRHHEDHYIVAVVIIVLLFGLLCMAVFTCHTASGATEQCSPIPLGIWEATSKRGKESGKERKGTGENIPPEINFWWRPCTWECRSSGTAFNASNTRLRSRYVPHCFNCVSSDFWILTWSPRRSPAMYGLESGSSFATKTPPPLSTPPAMWKFSTSSRLVRDRMTSRRRDPDDLATHSWRNCDVMARDSSDDSRRSANSHSDASPPTSKSHGDDVIHRTAMWVACHHSNQEQTTARVL